MSTGLLLLEVQLHFKSMSSVSLKIEVAKKRCSRKLFSLPCFGVDVIGDMGLTSALWGVDPDRGLGPDPGNAGSMPGGGRVLFGGVAVTMGEGNAAVGGAGVARAGC